MPKQSAFCTAIYSHGKIQQVICAWGKSHGLAHVLNCTSHGSDWLFLFQSGKKVKSHVVPCLITPLTKNKQEHSKRQQIPFHSYLVSVQHSLGQVSAVLRPLQLLDPGRESTHEGDIWGHTGTRTKCDRCLNTWQSNDGSYWLFVTILNNVNKFSS